MNGSSESRLLTGHGPRNVLVCFPGNPFRPIDLANMFDRGINTKAVGSIQVDHYRMEDAFRSVIDEQIDQRDDRDSVLVVVYHIDVDVETRVCQSCGKSCGTGRLSGFVR